MRAKKKKLKQLVVVGWVAGVFFLNLLSAMIFDNEAVTFLVGMVIGGALTIIGLMMFMKIDELKFN